MVLSPQTCHVRIQAFPFPSSPRPPATCRSRTHCTEQQLPAGHRYVHRGIRSCACHVQSVLCVVSPHSVRLTVTSPHSSSHRPVGSAHTSLLENGCSHQALPLSSNHLQPHPTSSSSSLPTASGGCNSLCRFPPTFICRILFPFIRLPAGQHHLPDPTHQVRPPHLLQDQQVHRGLSEHRRCLRVSELHAMEEIH